MSIYWLRMQSLFDSAQYFISDHGSHCQRKIYEIRTQQRTCWRKKRQTVQVPKWQVVCLPCLCLDQTIRKRRRENQAWGSTWWRVSERKKRKKKTKKKKQAGTELAKTINSMNFRWEKESSRRGQLVVCTRILRMFGWRRQKKWRNQEETGMELK